MRESAGSVEGFCTPRFEPLRQLFEELIESGQDLGASLVVTVDGEFALDLWGGWADEARSRPWQRDTLPFIPDGRICMWGGAGGSFVIIDVDWRLTLDYVMNKIVAALITPNMTALATCFYGIVGG